MKCSKKVLKKCLKVCGKAIHLPRLNDGRVRNREKNCVLDNFKQNTSKKSNSIMHNLFCIVNDNNFQTGKLCNTRCLRDNANVIT